MKRMQLTAVAIVLATGITLESPAANAGLLGWWRMGDDDAAPVDAAPIDAAGTANNGGSFGPLLPSDSTLEYATVLPGAMIYDPLADATHANSWSTTAPGALHRALTETQTVPEAFSYETFVRFDDLDGATGEVRFAYQWSNANGGWRISLMPDDTLRLQMRANGNTSNIDLALPAVTESVWHHVGLIFDGNSQDGSDDVHFYLDYTEVTSTNFDDGSTFGGTMQPFYNGNVLTGVGAVRLDESRYFDTAMARDGSQFLRAVPEPGALTLLAAGSLAAAMAVLRRRRT